MSRRSYGRKFYSTLVKFYAVVRDPKTKKENVTNQNPVTRSPNLPQFPVPVGGPIVAVNSPNHVSRGALYAQR